MNLDANYWNNRYLNENTPWDASEITSPLQNYFDQLEDKSIKILVPGAGNAHEAIYLYNNGFKNVYICDWASAAIENFHLKFPIFPKKQLICADFFELKDTFDLIVEQTFFCALPPQLRKPYAQKVAQLLNKKGKLMGLLFAKPFDKQGPPFGGTKSEYEILFSTYFDLKIIESSYNSIKPRDGKELFILFEKASH